MITTSWVFPVPIWVAVSLMVAGSAIWGLALSAPPWDDPYIPVRIYTPRDIPWEYGRIYVTSDIDEFRDLSIHQAGTMTVVSTSQLIAAATRGQWFGQP